MRGSLQKVLSFSSYHQKYWKWLICNPGNIIAIIALIVSLFSLWFTYSQTVATYNALSVSLNSFNFDVESFNKQAKNQQKLEKINEVGKIGSVLYELFSNYEYLNNKSKTRNEYFVEENGIYISGEKIVQDSLSVENIAEYLKTPTFKDQEDINFTVILWRIKNKSIEINNKIFDARLNSLYITPEERRKKQKEIFDEFDKIYPEIIKAKEMVTELQKKVQFELNQL